jgi:hypothetical protein
MTAVFVFSYDTPISVARVIEHKLPFDKMDIYEREFSTHLPVIVIQTNVNELYNRETPPGAVIWFFDGETENRLTDVPTKVFELARVRYRGYSSLQLFPKKQFWLSLYSFNTPSFEPFKYGFSRFEPASRWVLHSPYVDKSLIRNWFAYEIAATVHDWQPRGMPVQLFLQDGEYGMIEYQGVYLLCESITVGESRLDLGDFRLSYSETIDFEGGGYVVQLDRDRYDYFTLTIGGDNIHIRYSHPSSSDMTARQDAQLRSEIEFFFKLITNYDNVPVDDWDYQNYIDVQAFIDYFLVAEMLGNVDTGVSSTFIHRPIGGKFVMGPQWDFDITMGNYDYSMPYYDSFIVLRRQMISSLLNDPSFAVALIDRWAELRSTIWSDNELFGLFDTMVEYMVEPAAQNAERWPDMYDGLTHELWPEESWEEITERTRIWLENRLCWLDRNIPRLINESPEEIYDNYQFPE